MTNGEQMVEVVYTGPKVFRTMSGHGESREVILHKPGDVFKIPIYTYANMKDVLTPLEVYEAQKTVAGALKNAEEVQDENENKNENKDGDEE